MNFILLLLFIFISILNVITEEDSDIYTKAAACPHRFHMGCLLDVLEKACTGLQNIQECTENGKCKDVSELDRLVGALVAKNFESVDRCCCTKAFKTGGYENCETPDLICKHAIERHVRIKEWKRHWKILKECVKTPNKQACFEALKSANWAIEAIQKARGEMWSVPGCQMLAPMKPISTCGWDVKPEPRAIERADLYCDTIIWQYKEMGASDPFISECPNAPELTKTAGQNEEEEEDDDEEEEDEDGHSMEKNRKMEEEL